MATRFIKCVLTSGFYVIFITTKAEREEAKRNPKYGDAALAGHQMGYAANSNLEADKDDPVVQQVRNAVGGEKGNNQNDLFTTVYKNCWPCK